MSPYSEPEPAEDAFFGALLSGDVGALEDVLADDFLIVDVMSGNVADREGFLGPLGDRSLRFESIDLVERQTRTYGDAAVIVGRTAMKGSFGELDFSASSRYTHVLVRADGEWRLASAQGTQIVDP